MAFNEDAFKRGRRTSMKRLEAYRGLRKEDNRRLYEAAKAFYDRIQYEGREIDAGRTPAEDTAVVRTLVRELQRAKAFSARGDWWIDNQDRKSLRRDSKWEEALGEASDRHVQNTGAWSKTTGMPAELRAILNDGRTLELSPGADWLDAIETGLDRATPSPTLNYMWGHASETFMGESRGMLHADVYRGIDENSVLNKIEMPALLDRIEAGQVDGVTFHVRRRNQQTGVLDETAEFSIHSRGSWDQVMTLDRTPSYDAEQGREYQTQQIGRAILRNRMGMHQSLDDFRAIFEHAQTDPDTVVFMSGPGAAAPWPEGQVTRERMAAWQRHPSLDSQAGQNWPAGTSAAQTLHEKLYAHAATQGSVSSASTGSGPQVPADLARMESYQTTTTHSSGSGNYVVPVNSAASNQGGMHMSPGFLQELPPGGQASTFTYPIPTNSAAQLYTPDYGVNHLTSTMSHMSVGSPGQADSVSERQDYLGDYHGADASHGGYYGADASHGGYYGADASHGGYYGADASHGGYYGADTTSPAPYYAPTSTGYTMNTTLSNQEQPSYTMNTTLSNQQQPSYTMNTTLTNPTGGYAQPVPGGSRSQGSTSSSDGIGDELTRVDHHRSATPSPPPSPARKGRR